MTEGGGSCILYAHEFPDKLHTVGQPAPGHEIRLIDEQGREVPRGEVGEIVGRSPASMMNGYFNQPGKTAEAEWYDSEGNRYIRTGDVGRFDEQGFLTLMDRRKDMIISGGFNIYPSDLESVLIQHEAIKEAAVVGVPSRQWGETPVAFVVLKPGRTAIGGGDPRVGERASRQDAAAAHRSRSATCCRAARSARCSSASCAISTLRSAALPDAACASRGSSGTSTTRK